MYGGGRGAGFFLRIVDIAEPPKTCELNLNELVDNLWHKIGEESMECLEYGSGDRVTVNVLNLSTDEDSDVI